VPQVHRDYKVFKAQPVQQEQTEQQARRVHKDWLELMEQRVHRDYKVFKAQPVRQEQTEQQAHRVLRD
jgi:hypothetical protein